MIKKGEYQSVLYTLRINLKMKKWILLIVVIIVVFGVGYVLVSGKMTLTPGPEPTSKPTLGATLSPSPTLTPTTTLAPSPTTELTPTPAPTKELSKNDTKAPVISGMVGKNSYFSDSVFMVVYPDKKYDFTRYVKVKDDTDSTVDLQVNTDQVDYNKEGDYPITFTATDSSGNKSTATGKVHVRIPKKIDSMADEILGEIVKNSMSDQQKAEAVYTYIRKNYSYVNNYNETNWEKAAEYGMKYDSGDCFMFYSVSRALLTRLGIPNLMVTRYKGEGHHWWNLVYVEGGWYHFDTTPRNKQATFCLVTSAQLENYSKKAGNTHIWNVPEYPKTATKEISSVKWGKRY